MAKVNQETIIMNHNNELVDYFAFKDGDKYKDDIFVSVNGRTFQIKRGEWVKIPRYVRDVLESSARQDKKTADLIERESSSYRKIDG